MRLMLAQIVGKAVYFFSNLFNLGGGSAAPGLYALKIGPNLVSKLGSQIPLNIIVIGTNGKTTTSKMIAHLAQEANLRIIRNHTGSNLERGIASTLIKNLPLINIHTKFDLGVWELDEAAFNQVGPKLQPDVIIFLNIFRDQLDRYGELDTIIHEWIKTLKLVPQNTQVILNADDANILKLAQSIKNPVKLFGIRGKKISGESVISTKIANKLDFEARNIDLQGLQGSQFELFFNVKSSILSHKSLIPNPKSLIIDLPIPGLYHIYDAVAALGGAQLLGLPIKKIASSLANFTPAFGRVERLPFGYIFLIKNPAGATQVLETIAPQIKPADRLLFVLNDNLADGTDVSWIWDSVFEKLQTIGNKQMVICSGTRAHDMAVRLKYAGFEPTKIVIEPSLDIALKGAQRGLKGLLYILPTYTAMLELQAILARNGFKKDYWKEEDE